MHFAIVVLDKLLDEGPVLLQYLVSHIRDIVQNRLILHLRTMDTFTSLETPTPCTAACSKTVVSQQWLSQGLL